MRPQPTVSFIWIQNTRQACSDCYLVLLWQTQPIHKYWDGNAVYKIQQTHTPNQTNKQNVWSEPAPSPWIQTPPSPVFHSHQNKETQEITSKLLSLITLTFSDNFYLKFLKFFFSQLRTLEQERQIWRRGRSTLQSPIAENNRKYSTELRTMPFTSQTKTKKGGEKSHKCPMCASSFTTAGNLKRHILVHIGEKPFSCNQCEYKCTHADHLKRHMLTHSGEKPFTCMQCEFSCTTASDLKRHILKHRGEKPFSCNQCNYKCTQAIHLKMHMLTHNLQKSFACNQCSYTCTLADHLKKHMLTHSGEKPFSCNQCDYKSTQAGTLKTHKLTHTGEKPFACKQCNYSSTTSSGLKSHMKGHNANQSK